ncbi:hypothetical protein Vafri_14956, partial [Volvox africanus]
ATAAGVATWPARAVDGGGGRDLEPDGGDKVSYYYCLTVSPTVCDSCNLAELDAVLASYTRLSRQSQPERHYVWPTDGAAVKPGVVVPGVGAATSSPAVAAAPAGAAGYLPSVGWPSYDTTLPYPVVPTGPSADVPFFPGRTDEVGVIGGDEGTVAELAAPPVGGAAAAALAAAAWEAVASAAAAPDGTTRLATRVVGAARAVGEALVAAAHSLAYDIRRRADEIVRQQVMVRGAGGTGRIGGRGRAATLLPLRAAVIMVWLLARAAAVAVGVMTEVLAATGAVAAEFVLFSGALFTRWIPFLMNPGRRQQRPMGLRTAFLARTGLYAGSSGGGWGLIPGVIAALALPSHMASTMAGTALLVYGELHASLEEGARVLLRALADAASQLAEHAGGPEAAGLTRGSLEAIGYAIDAITGVRKIGLRAVAREYQRRQAAAMLGPPPPPPTMRRRRR